jgi:hypothetical protein
MFALVKEGYLGSVYDVDAEHDQSSEERVAGDLVNQLRVDLGAREVSPALLRKHLDTAAVSQLRRYYFPLYQPHTVRNPDPAARMSSKVVVPDPFEQSLVLAVAPTDIRVDVVVLGPGLLHQD